MQVDAMREANDPAGHWMWCRILTRIAALGPSTDDIQTML